MPNDNNTSNKSDNFKTPYANLSEADRQKLTELEQTLQKETGEKVALVAYRL